MSQNGISEFDPLVAVTLVNQISSPKVGYTSVAISAAQICQGLIGQAGCFLVNFFLWIKIKYIAVGFPGLLEDDFPMQIGGVLPAPGPNRLGYPYIIPLLFECSLFDDDVNVFAD